MTPFGSSGAPRYALGMQRGAIVLAGLVLACSDHHAAPSRCGPAATDAAVVYWDVGVYGAIAVGVGGWYDPYTYDEWGDGTIDDGTGDAPPDDNGGDEGSDNGGGGDEGSDENALRVTPENVVANADGCFACTLTCVFSAPAGQANAVTSVGGSDASYVAACGSAQHALGAWGRANHTRFIACGATDGLRDRVPARPTPQ